MEQQPKLFAGKRAADATERERLVLYALGEFQARGLALAGRELPLDRLRGALRSASEDLGIEELDDEASVEAFEAMGARVRRVPSFVAKHPFRVMISGDLAVRARKFYEEQAAPSDDEATS
jgi:anti-sigma factor RsiW